MIEFQKAMNVQQNTESTDYIILPLQTNNNIVAESYFWLLQNVFLYQQSSMSSQWNR